MIRRRKIGKFAKRYVTLTKNREFQFLFRKGVSAGTYAFACYVFKSKRRVNRLGIITSKKIGNSVKRSRARRVIREAFRKIEPQLREMTGNRFDFAFVARIKTAETSPEKICELIKKSVLPKIFPDVTQKPNDTKPNRGSTK
jgi:ribonuclease P protein component